ncbi:hypothetical protein RM190_07510 [Paracoccus sp. CPCC 101403]|uniref:Secreted protein n=1 Tax=Paracoccus broussonetiae TaxID=3075834 RepID=A0ABU3EC38_9RHOB|nr:hypothetical protein [Paracoccus sp. CPCC 101403]MDT1061701.1 hypothetical protein [Paracoccus sp. CPCC 101403]
MIELFFVTCLTASPMQCQDRSLLFTQDVGLMTCMIQGQSQLAEWKRSHPRETIHRWGCRSRGNRIAA